MKEVVGIFRTRTSAREMKPIMKAIFGADCFMDCFMVARVGSVGSRRWWLTFDPQQWLRHHKKDGATLPSLRLMQDFLSSLATTQAGTIQYLSS